MKRTSFLAIIIALLALMTTSSCKKEGLEAGGGAAAGGKANLTIETVGGPDKQDCGGFDWKVKFNLNNASAKGGWIVQKITYDRVVIKCPDMPYINSKITYWEAWRVSAGASGDSERLSGKFTFDDYYHSGNFPDTRGSTTITGEVKFFEDLTLPAAFTKGNRATYAGDLPATTDKPDFWDNANSADHNLSLVWNCCTNPSTSVLTYTPTTPKAEHAVAADTNLLDNTGKLIYRIPNWIDGYYTTSSAQQLVNIAKQVQYISVTSLHNSIVNYERLFAGTTDYLKQMSKVYLMLRMLYQLPVEMNGSNAKTFGGWIHPSIGTNTAFNMTWPVFTTQSPSGTQASVATYCGFIGRGYNAAAELDYFNANFPKRNL